MGTLNIISTNLYKQVRVSLCDLLKMFVHCTYFSHVMKSKTLFNIHFRMIEQNKRLSVRFMVKPHTSDIRMTYEHIRVTYGWIRVTYGWHTSTYEWYMDDIRVHMNDISMTYEYMRVTYEWHTSIYEWHTSDIRITYENYQVFLIPVHFITMSLS